MWSDNTLYHLVNFKHSEPFTVVLVNVEFETYGGGFKKKKSRDDICRACQQHHSLIMHPCPANRARRNQWPVKNQTIQVGNYTLMHSWRLRRLPPSLFLIMYERCRYGDTQGRSVTEHTTIHSYTNPHGSSYCLLFLQEPCNAPIQPVSRMSLKAPPSLLRLLALFAFLFFFFFYPPPPQTEIPAFLCTLLLFGVLLSISISDMGESEVSVCLGAEVMGEEMWRRRRCHLIRSWRRLSGGRAIVGQGCCRGLVFMSTSLCGRETTLLKRWLEIEISSVTERITGWITHTLLQFMHTMWTFLQ